MRQVIIRSVKAISRAAPLLMIVVLMLWNVQLVNAAQITPRKLTLGSSAGGASTTHKYDFNTGSTHSIGSIRFQYCTDASCTTPLGDSADTDGVTLDAQSGATGFSVDATGTDANDIVITRTAASVTGGTSLSYTFGSAVNRATTNSTWFVKITTYTGTDGSTGPTDTGVVAASTATQISLTGSLGETLVFCTGTSITGTDCNTVSGSTVNFGSFSSTATSSGTSVMAASTNAAGGYAVTVNGATLTSGGGDTITALSSPTASSTGTEQFGLNLKDNATPNVGAEVSPSPNGTTLKGQASAGYNTADNYKFVTGNQVAASDNGGTGPTNAQTFTVSYIVNVAGNTEPGTYTATMTYICTATF